MAHILMTYIVMAHILMTYIVMAHILMTYIVLALYSYGLYSHPYSYGP